MTMFQDVKVTLYDLFGYLLPGFVFLSGLAVLSWSMFFPRIPVQIRDLGTTTWLLVAALAHLCGHTAQSFGNLLVYDLGMSAEDKVLSTNGSSTITKALVDLSRSRISNTLRIDLKEIKDTQPLWLYQLCDEAIVQRGTGSALSDREIYQYREGLYRGLVIAYLLITLAFIVRGIGPGASIRLVGSSQRIGTAIWFFFALVALTSAWFAWLRFRRFSRYRVTHAVLGFLLLPKSQEGD
jgi:hypothetical protein